MDDPEQPASEPPGHSGGSEPIQIVDDEHRLDEWGLRWLRQNAEAALDHLGVAGVVRIRLIGDDAMIREHERYLGLATPTDVLTFDLSEEPGCLEVDLLVGIDQATREAASRSIQIEREVLLYIIHGVLHCLGHDDHDPERAEEMHRVEDATLEALGVGATFARPVSDGDNQP